MNQLNWTYVGEQGKRYFIGLMHGAQSGHVLVHCNSKIILIDFTVLQTKTYSFFIEEEFCELTIERTEDKFAYALDINKDIDTPRNRRRKKRDKKHLLQSLGFTLAFFGIVTAFVYLMTSWSAGHNYQTSMILLQNKGVETKAKVIVDSKRPSRGISYQFIAKGRPHKVRPKTKIALPLILSNGMPLENGDEFVIKYLEQSPDVFEINYDKPTPLQIEKYFKKALAKHTQSNPNLDTKLCECQLKVAYELKGISAIADFYHQNTSPATNPDHNVNSFKRLTKDTPFIKAIEKKCW